MITTATIGAKMVGFDHELGFYPNCEIERIIKEYKKIIKEYDTVYINDENGLISIESFIERPNNMYDQIKVVQHQQDGSVYLCAFLPASLLD